MTTIDLEDFLNKVRGNLLHLTFSEAEEMVDRSIQLINCLTIMVHMVVKKPLNSTEKQQENLKSNISSSLKNKEMHLRIQKPTIL